MVMENKEKKPKIIIIIIGILIVITIIVVLVMGTKGIIKIIGSIATIGIFAALAFLLGYLFFIVFIKKQRFDPVFVNKQKLIKSGRMNLPEGVLNYLYLTGDSAHSRVKLGKIKGYQRIQIPVRKYVYELDKDGKPTNKFKMKPKKTPDDKPEPEYSYGVEEQDVFIVKNNFLQGIFTDPMVVRVRPEEHSSLIGDVSIKGFSLVPISEYYFINTSYLDRAMIDWTIGTESDRIVFFEHLRDEKTIMDRAIGLDSTHKKEIEQKNLFEMNQQGGPR